MNHTWFEILNWDRVQLLKVCTDFWTLFLRIHQFFNSLFGFILNRLKNIFFFSGKKNDEVFSSSNHFECDFISITFMSTEIRKKRKKIN